MDPDQVLFAELSRLERTGILDQQAFVRIGTDIVDVYRDQPAHIKGDILESIRTYAPDEEAWEALRAELLRRGLTRP